MASGGSEICAVWFDRPSTTYMARRFDLNGNPLAAAFSVEPAFDDPAFNPRPGVVWDGRDPKKYAGSFKIRVATAPSADKRAS